MAKVIIRCDVDEAALVAGSLRFSAVYAKDDSERSRMMSLASRVVEQSAVALVYETTKADG